MQLEENKWICISFLETRLIVSLKRKYRKTEKNYKYAHKESITQIMSIESFYDVINNIYSYPQSPKGILSCN